jgi:DNA invertase Pin-like site-specific DNA recombinase
MSGLVYCCAIHRERQRCGLERPELMRLLGEAEAGDVLLVESIDRLSRLTQKEWATLKQRIQDKGLVIVAVDLPTSWQLLNETASELTSGIQSR